MASRPRRKTVSVSVMMTGLMLASWETILRRTLLMAQNKCSPAEYWRMVKEKTEAAAVSGLTLAAGGGRASVKTLLAPWYARAKSNARRLRSK
jgi:hypothetical protein